jgi:enolase
MILPTGANSFSEALRYGTEVYHSLATVIFVINFSDH